MTDSDQLAAGIDHVLRRIAQAADAAGRDPGAVALLLAVKTRSDAEVLAALRVLAERLPAGARPLLGHNRVQELVAAGPALLGSPGAPVPAHEMHVIGPLQSNKINQALRWATSVDTVCDATLATKLDAAVGRRLDAGEGVGPHAADRLDVLVQVNTSGEATKSGVDPAHAPDLVAHVATLPRLRLRGFLTIGAHTEDEAAVRASFDALREVRDGALASGLPGTGDARELSMGMSGDLETAIACGATTVRLGTAVFGPRPA